MRSLTTIATPHYGSVTADRLCLVNAKCGAVLPIVNQEPGINLALNSSRFWSALMPDLRVSNATVFSLRPDPQELSIVVGSVRVAHKVAYQAIWADANLNDSCTPGPNVNSPAVTGPHPGTASCGLSSEPTISQLSDAGAPDESIGYELPDPDVQVWFLTDTRIDKLRVGETAYRLVFKNDRIVRGRCNQNSASTTQCIVYGSAAIPNLNDFSVSKSSALPRDLYTRLERFTDLGGVRANHTTVGRAATGITVLNSIKLIESSLRFQPAVSRP